MSDATSSVPSTAGSRNLKRERDTSNAAVLDDHGNSPVSPSSSGTTAATTSNFRNVSACNRCRNRKNRCDQKLPRCTNCERANVKCVGFDPVSKREIPRSYVYYLETRVNNLEALLKEHGIPCPPASDDFPIDEAIKPGVNVPFPVQDEDPSSQRPSSKTGTTGESQLALDPALKLQDDNERVNRLANNIGMVSVQGQPGRRRMGSPAGPSAGASGLSFARVVFAAVKRSVNNGHAASPSERNGARSSLKQRASSLSSGAPDSTSTADASDNNRRSSSSGSTMRDSFFGLHTKPGIAPAPFPDRALGTRLAELYFEYANPQIPVLHRGEFAALFDRVYAAPDPRARSPRELYLLHIVFAIGSGIIMDSPDVVDAPDAQRDDRTAGDDSDDVRNRKRLRLASHQHQPEEYHAAAIVHLERFLGSAPAMEGAAAGLEELQAVLLLAGLALLRPVAPGLWYIIGVAVRLSVDLGLHTEDIDPELDNRPAQADGAEGTDGEGRKQWHRDLRRRLWWCVFKNRKQDLDRLVSSCVGRPVSISETVVTTEFPSLLDDKYITPSGFLKAPSSTEAPSYKFVSRHYLRLRLLQSEILQVLQHRQSDLARQMGASQSTSDVIPALNSPFLQHFQSFRDWRADIDRRLWQWKEEAPRQSETGVAFTPLFYELNFWQAIIMLYRQSLAVPEPLANELSPETGEDVQSPGAISLEAEEDKQMVLLKVAQAGQTVLKIYRQLHRLKLVNYTFLATHHLFMSGISFLYAIWGSTLVRSQLTIDDVDFTVLAATSVLSDLINKCPPAEACRDAFVRMSKATISMVMSSTGFGNASTLGSQQMQYSQDTYFAAQSSNSMSVTSPSAQRSIPKFHVNLRDLFSEEELASRPPLSQSAPARPTNIRVAQPHSPSANVPVSPFSDVGTALMSTEQQAFNPSAKPPSPPRAHSTLEWGDYANLDLDFLDDFSFNATDVRLSVADGAASQSWNAVGPPSTTVGQASSYPGFTSFPSGMAAGASSIPNASFDSSGAWEANGELFDTFFFGPTSGGGAGGGF